MLITELTIEKCRAVLRGTNLGRLACVRSSQPYLVPIYFDVADDYLYSVATLGQKIRWMCARIRVSAWKLTTSRISSGSSPEGRALVAVRR